MKKHPKRFGLCGDSKPLIDIVPNELREIRGGAGSTLDPNGLRLEKPSRHRPDSLDPLRKQ